MRTPVAAQIAFASAGAAVGMPISPHPDGDSVESTTMTSMSRGICAMVASG
jgi:hypothetical protein